MKLIVRITIVVMGLVAAGCTQQGHYPITGEACGPTDPVLDMTVPDCDQPAGV